METCPRSAETSNYVYDQLAIQADVKINMIPHMRSLGGNHMRFCNLVDFKQMTCKRNFQQYIMQ